MSSLTWHKVATKHDLKENRVKSVSCGTQSICLTHYKNQFAALDNRCPHQGGPLGDGSIENGMLRCPWHGWDFDPITGKPPGGYDDGIATFALELRGDDIYVGVEDAKKPEPTVGDVMIETMVNWGIKHVFGMVGHSNLNLAEAIRLQENHLNYYGIRHEGAASFACSAYGKLTGKPAACLTIAGPGATNLLTGLWDAHVDSAPVLALTGQIPSKLIGRGAFQEVDLSKAFGQVATWTADLTHASNYPELMTLACKHAIVKQSVSHLVFPDEIPGIACTQKADTPSGRITSKSVSPDPATIHEASTRIAQAKRPVIIMGYGARFHKNSIIELATTLRCPVLTTFKGKGLIPDSHPNGCGVLGRSGTPIASWFMNESDLLIVLGSSFSNHTGITDKKPIIQVDIDPMQLGRFHKVDIPVWGDLGVAVSMFKEQLQGNISNQEQVTEIAERWTLWRKEKKQREQEDFNNGISSATLFASLTKLIPDDAIIPVDVGNNAYSFGRYFECTHQAILMSGYLGSIGFALPAALGAWAATTEQDSPFYQKPVVSISGDGGFAQYMAEITTAVQCRMNITHILLNNHSLGKISKEQQLGQWNVWQTDLVNPNFAHYATNCGAQGIHVENKQNLDAAIIEALQYQGPSLVEVMMDPTLL